LRMVWELVDDESLLTCRTRYNRKSVHNEKLSNNTPQKISIMIWVKVVWAKHVDSTGKMRPIRTIYNALWTDYLGYPVSASLIVK
jgi:hypothetical protein